MAFLDETGLAELWGLICEKHDGFVNEHLWRTVEYLPTYSEEETVPLHRMYTTNETTTFSYADKCDADKGTLVEPISTVTFSYNSYTNATVLKGKYWMEGSILYYTDPTANLTRNNNNGERFDVYLSKTKRVIGIEVGPGAVYFSSPDINAYPPAEGDGRTYEYLGQMGEKARIATGSYMGTGKYYSDGSNFRNSLTFNFKPSLVLVFAPTFGGRIFTIPPKDGQSSPTDISYSNYVEWSGNTVYWYSGNNSSYQFNSTNMTYYYIAIG